MEIVNSTKSSTYRLLEKLIDSNRLFSAFSAIHSRFDSIRLTDSTSTKPTSDHIEFSTLMRTFHFSCVEIFSDDEPKASQSEKIKT